MRQLAPAAIARLEREASAEVMWFRDTVAPPRYRGRMRRCALLGLALAACPKPAPEQPGPAPQPPVAEPPLAPEEPTAPPDRFTAFFTDFCAADDAAKLAMLAPSFIGQSRFVPGGQDAKFANEASGLIVTDLGDRVMVPTFPMCEPGTESTYAVAQDGHGSARIGGHEYRVGFALEPLQLTHLLLKLPPDPTAHAPPPATAGEVFISTMQVPSTPVPAALQRRLESFLVGQRGCVDAYAATTDDPVGASLDLVVPVDGAPYLSARTVANLDVLACFEARLSQESWEVETEARLLLHYGVPVSASSDTPTARMPGAR